MRKSRTAGFILPSTLAIVFSVAIMGATLALIALTSLRSATDETRRLQAFYSANSGLERTYARVQNTLAVLTAPTSATGATAIATAVDGTSGDVPGGRFTVTATADGSEVILRSDGFSTNDGSRRAVQMRFNVTVPPPVPVGTVGLAAPAAITTTGAAQISGNAPVAGATTGSGLSFGFTCTTTTVNGSTSCLSSGQPVTYNVDLTSGTTCDPPTLVGPPADSCLNIGDYLTNPSNTDAKYLVSDINGSQVQLTAISEEKAITTVSKQGKTVITGYQAVPLAPASGNSLTLPLDNTASAILYYNQNPAPTLNGSNTSSNCTTYGCDRFGFPPAELFETVFGVDKTTFKNSLSADAKSATDKCSPTVLWITTTTGDSPLVSCDNPRVVVIDASQVPQSTTKISIKTNNIGFRGLLYVIGNGKSKLALEGNGTTVAGAVVAETGLAADGTNPIFDMTGTAKVAVCAGSQAKDPKICYDKSVLDGLIDDLRNVVVPPIVSLPPSVARVTNSWQEVPGQ